MMNTTMMMQTRKRGTRGRINDNYRDRVIRLSNIDLPAVKNTKQIILQLFKANFRGSKTKI